uniref:MULE transposase domain-containing protein n=1 Tax=Amphimedon queenslandica TaxID=400682 RepID=A0A1X7THV4_AMPQE
MSAEINRLLLLKSGGAQLLSYDTTFKLGDFYVSPILFRNILFRSNPVMPAMFMIHERKLKTTHDELMKIVAKELPCLVHGTQSVSMVTDEERGFVSIDEHLPKVCRFFCWNHIINSAKNWLKGHGATSAEVPVYVGNIRNLLHKDSYEQYELCLDEVKRNWSQPFLQYYMSEIHVKIEFASRWNLEKHGIYSPVSGVTNNQSEGFNSVLKRLQSWKKISIDTALLSLYHLHAYYRNEWQRGLAGLGEHRLKDEFLSASISLDEIEIMENISLEEIVKRINEGVDLSEHAEAHEFVETVSAESVDVSGTDIPATYLEDKNLRCTSSQADEKLNT